MIGIEKKGRSVQVCLKYCNCIFFLFIHDYSHERDYVWNNRVGLKICGRTLILSKIIKFQSSYLTNSIIFQSPFQKSKLIQSIRSYYHSSVRCAAQSIKKNLNRSFQFIKKLTLCYPSTLIRNFIMIQIKKHYQNIKKVTL